MTHHINVINTDSPTRIAQNSSSSLLDLPIVSPSLQQKTSLTIKPDAFDSDHLPIAIELSLNFNNKNKTTHPIILWSEAGNSLNDTLSLPEQNIYSLNDFTESCRQQ